MFDTLKTSFDFNKDRIYEMHRLLRMVASMQDMPGCTNPIVLDTIQQCKDYIVKWEALKDVYPGGIPVLYGNIDIPDSE